MAVPIVVKYNGVALDDVTTVNWDNVMDSMGSAAFHVPNQKNENQSTWEARRWSEIVQIYDDAATLLWSGYIIAIGQGDPLKISCLGVTVVSTYDVLTESNGKFIVDSVIVKVAPTDSELDVWTDEEEDPGWTSDQWGKDSNYPDRYAIISDNTLKEVNDVHQADSDTVTNCDETNDYDDTQTANATLWRLEPTAFNADMFATAKLALGGDIDDASVLTKVKIEAYGYTYANMGMGGEPQRFRIFWDRDQDKTKNADCPFEMYWDINPLDDPPPWIIDAEFIVEDGDTDRWLNSGGGFWTGGGLCFQWEKGSAGTHNQIYLEVQYIKVTFYSMTENFETINRKIYDVTGDAGFDTLQTYNDAEDGAEDLDDHGIAADDKVDIAIGVLEAVNKINMRGLRIIINEGTDPKAGTTQNYVGVTPHDVYVKLFEQMGYVHFTDYSTGEPILKALDPDDIDNATVTYDVSNDPPTWNSPMWYEADQYGKVIVQYYQGALTGEFVGNASNPRTKLERKPEILTRTEANTFGKLRAAYYGTDHISIQLTWSYMPTNYPYVGAKYNFTDLKLNAGAFANNSFTNKVCRRTSGQWLGGNNPVNIQSWIGLASTPADEKEERWKADISRYIKLNESLRGTSSYSPITRHPQLLGITASDHHSKYTDAEAATKIATDDLYVKVAGDKLSGDIEIEKANPFILLDSTGGNADFIADAAAGQDASLQLYENGAPKAQAVYDSGTNQLILETYNDEAVLIKVNSAEKFDLTTAGLQLGGANARVGEFSTDGTLAGNSDTAVPTEQAVKEYVDNNKYTDAEAAAKIADDDLYVKVAGDTMTGSLTLPSGETADSFVWRTEPVAWDYREGGGNTDFSTIGDVGNTWYDLDLSGILPANTKAVYLRLLAHDNLVGSEWGFRKNGQGSGYQVTTLRVQVANQWNSDLLPFVAVDGDRKIEFNANPKASDWGDVRLMILGWII